MNFELTPEQQEALERMKRDAAEANKRGPVEDPTGRFTSFIPGLDDDLNPFAVRPAQRPQDDEIPQSEPRHPDNQQ
jgi:hypothetical protein